MTDIWLDYSFARPSLAEAKAAGVVGVIRYLAPPDPNNAKILTPGERDAILAAGLDLALVYESYAERALEGAVAGAQDALIALAGARALGYPEGACLYFAVDTDTTDYATIGGYFATVRAELHGAYRVGVYGSYGVVAAMLTEGLADCAWQTVAWSNRQRHPDAVLYQNGTQWFNGAADVNEVTGHVGSWLQPTEGDDMSAQAEQRIDAIFAQLGTLVNAAYTIEHNIGPAVNAIRAQVHALGDDADTIIAYIKTLPDATVAAIAKGLAS